MKAADVMKTIMVAMMVSGLLMACGSVPQKIDKDRIDRSADDKTRELKNR